MTLLPFEDLPSQSVKADQFDTVFWPAWPHKVDKKNARKALKTALRSATLDDIMAGVEWYVKHKPPWRSWKGPAAWLNAEAWRDWAASKFQHDARHTPQITEDERWASLARSIIIRTGMHKYPRQDVEECYRRKLLTREQMEEAL